MARPAWFLLDAGIVILLPAAVLWLSDRLGTRPGPRGLRPDGLSSSASAFSGSAPGATYVDIGTAGVGIGATSMALFAAD